MRGAIQLSDKDNHKARRAVNRARVHCDDISRFLSQSRRNIETSRISITIGVTV